MANKGIIVGLVALILSGCSTMGGSFCKVMTGEDGKPILEPTEADVDAVSTRLAVGLVTVLETGEKECGWKPNF